MIKLNYRSVSSAFKYPVVVASAVMLFAGCNRQDAADTLSDAKTSAKQTAESVAEDVGAAAEKGEKMIGELSENAKAYLAPLEQKFGNLDDLKDSPEKLKAAVEELIQSIEKKAESIKLPESVSKTLETVKNKLIDLRDDLEDDIEQSKIDEHVRDIIASVKSGLGIS